MFGADGAGAHAKSEWTTQSSVRMLADILTETAVEFCR
jgi:acetylornithine deacetylase